MLDYSFKFIDGDKLLFLLALVFSTILICHFFYLYFLNKHIKEKASVRNLLLKNQELIEGNYKSLQFFLMSITELNGLFEAHLAAVNDSTEKASLAIIDKLLCVEVEASRLSLVLGNDKKIAEEMCDENSRRVEVCLQSINEIGFQMERYCVQREQDSMKERAIIIKAKELTFLASIMKDCLAYTDFMPPRQVIKDALNGNPEPLYLITEKDMHSLKKCVDVATFRIEEIAIQITDDLTVSASLPSYFESGSAINWMDSGKIAIQNIAKELKSVLTNRKDNTSNDYESIAIMRANILDALTHTQFQDISRQQIEVVAKGLGLCGRYSVELSQALDIDELEQVSAPNLKDEVIQILQSSYTMESQRVTHAKTTGDDIALEKASYPVFELF